MGLEGISMVVNVERQTFFVSILWGWGYFIGVQADEDGVYLITIPANESSWVELDVKSIAARFFLSDNALDVGVGRLIHGRLRER